GRTGGLHRMRQSTHPFARATRAIVGTAILAGASLGLVSSCGPVEASLTVEIAPKTVVIGSDRYATVTITGMSNGTKIMDGSVQVETTLGTFVEDDVYRTADPTFDGGKATVRLYPTTKGEAKVTA